MHPDEDSDARYKVILAISSGISWNFNDCRDINSFFNLGFNHNLICLSVAIDPGDIEFTLILYFPNSLAKDLVNPKIADYADEYKINPGAPVIQHIDDRLIIEPPLFFIIPFFTAFAEKK